MRPYWGLLAAPRSGYWAENHEFSNLELNKQPMQVNLSIGGQNFTAFVDNISQEQGRQTDLELQF